MNPDTIREAAQLKPVAPLVSMLGVGPESILSILGAPEQEPSEHLQTILSEVSDLELLGLATYAIPNNPVGYEAYEMIFDEVPGIAAIAASQEENSTHFDIQTERSYAHCILSISPDGKPMISVSRSNLEVDVIEEIGGKPLPTIARNILLALAWYGNRKLWLSREF